MNLGGVGRSSRTNRLDYGGDQDYSPDPGVFKKDSLFTIAVLIGSQE